MIESADPPRSIEQISRYIGKVGGKQKGPTLICFGGIHGNETAGVQALQHLFEKLNTESFQLRGTLIGIRGNIPALLQKKRFVAQDLNRLWIEKNITEIKNKPSTELEHEELELLELELTISDILDSYEPPFYFIDFHTTSSKTLPFITINDALINRKFSQQFPVPIILGIEEYLEGPLLSRMNKLGYVSLGFESGQHCEEAAVKNSVAFLWLTLVFSRMLEKQNVDYYSIYFNQLESSAKRDSRFYEVIHRHGLKKTDEFSMLSGYESFQKVTKGTLLAIQNKEKVYAKKNTIVFMPLYQLQGADGFFLIRKIPQWALMLSVILRKAKFDNLLTILPGIAWNSSAKQSLRVNLSVARFFAKPFFHLLGYRNRKIDKTRILMHNRERTARNKMYDHEHWY